MPRPLRALAVLTLVALVAAGCSRTRETSLPTPSSVTETTPSTTTTFLDFSTVALPAVPGRTTTTVVLGPGAAHLSGTVTGPDGAPLEGATVRAERVVGGGVASADVLTLPDGTWEIPAVLGGSYRVRAWRVPDLAVVNPELFFLAANEAKQVNLAVSRFAGVAVSAAIAPNPPLLDNPASLIVQVTTRRVDEMGIVQGVPVPGLLAEIFGPGDWRVQTPNPVATDAAGRARFQIVCRRVGENPLNVAVGDVPFPLNLPRCGAPPPPPEDPVVEPASVTSSTNAPATTTTTTRPPTTSTTKKKG